MLVPETPDARSSSSSSSIAAAGGRAGSGRLLRPVNVDARRSPRWLRDHVTSVMETPDSAQRGAGFQAAAAARLVVTRVEESPLSESDAHAAVQDRASPTTNAGKVIGLAKDASYVEWVAATQEQFASTKIGDDDKVDRWLANNEPGHSPPQNRPRRGFAGQKSLADGLRQMLFLKDAASQQKATPERGRLLQKDPADSISGSQSASGQRRRSSLLSAERPSISARTSRRSQNIDLSVKRVVDLSNDEEGSGEHSDTNDATDSAGPVQSQSFQDFSSDSAKALIAKLAQDNTEEKKDELDTLQKDITEADTDVEEDVNQQISLSEIFKDIVAYVEVRTGHENRSRCVIEELESLGATVSPKLTTSVTHCVFKDGALRTYNKAKKQGIHLVSVLWIEACKKERRIVDEGMFPTTSKERYDSPGLFPKIRKAKSMQPKTEEEMAQDLAASAKRLERKRKREERLAAAAARAEQKKEDELKQIRMQYPKSLYFYNSPKGAVSSVKAKAATAANHDKDSVMNVLKEIGSPLKTPLRRCSQSSKLSNCSFSSDDIDTPLARRLARQYFAAKSPGASQEAKSPRTLMETSTAGQDEQDDSRMSLTQTTPATRSHKRKLQQGCGDNALAASYNYDKSSMVMSTSCNSEQLNASNEAVDMNRDSYPGVPENKSKKEEPAPFTCPELANVTPDPAHQETVSPGPGSEPSDCDNKSRRPSSTRRSSARRTATSRRRALFTQSEDPFSETPRDLSLQLEQEAKKRPGKRPRRGRTKILKDQQGNMLATLQQNVVAASSSQKLSSQESGDCRHVSSCSAEEKEPPSSTASQGSIRLIQPPRRSSIEFVKRETKKRRGRRSMYFDRELVCTSCSERDYEVAVALSKQLGGMRIAKVVSEATTHVVSGAPKRTINILKGILRGCWILSSSWLYASVEADAWAQEETHELVSFSREVRQRICFARGVKSAFSLKNFSAVRKCRIQRQAFHRRFYSPDLFRSCGAIYLCASGCKVPVKELAELVRLGGGSIAKTTRTTGIFVGLQKEDKQCVNELWVLDSIQRSELQPIQSYLL